MTLLSLADRMLLAEREANGTLSPEHEADIARCADEWVVSEYEERLAIMAADALSGPEALAGACLRRKYGVDAERLYRRFWRVSGAHKQVPFPVFAERIREEVARWPE